MKQHKNICIASNEITISCSCSCYECPKEVQSSHQFEETGCPENTWWTTKGCSTITSRYVFLTDNYVAVLLKLIPKLPKPDFAAVIRGWLVRRQSKRLLKLRKSNQENIDSSHNLSWRISDVKKVLFIKLAFCHMKTSLRLRILLGWLLRSLLVLA